MKKLFITLLVISSFFSLLAFEKKATIKEPVLLQEESYRAWGFVSGESLLKYYKTNYIAKLTDGKYRQYAGIRFLAEDFDAIKFRIESIYAIDAKSEKMIDAKSAYYVINSKAKGTFSKFSKVAFEKEKDAKAFVKKYGGDIRDFDFTFYAATRDIDQDKEFYKKKQEKTYKRGEKAYKKMCKKIDIKDFDSFLALKSGIVSQKLCGNLKEKDLQALALYLWDVKRLGIFQGVKNRVQVTKDEKCPVCGMFVYKYPRWAAQIFFKLEGKEHHSSFDGVKDMMKFYFEPEAWGSYAKVKNNISKIVVTDYYSQQSIDAKKAYYVIGSDIYGPMGNELIPFSSEKDAKTFLLDHRGKEIVKFDEITRALTYKLDE